MDYNEKNQIKLAGCVILDDYDRLLLLHRAGDPGQWELPGGKVEAGESPELAAMRELSEELGVSVELTKKLGSETFEQDGQEYRYFWFQAKVIGGTPEVMETDAFDDLDYFEIEDLPSLSLSTNMEILGNKLLGGEISLSA